MIVKIKEANIELIKLWRELELNEWKGWRSFAMEWRNTHKYKPNGKPWKKKAYFTGQAAFKMCNFLLSTIGMPYIREAPIGIYPPSMPGDLEVEYKEGSFEIKWSDPEVLIGKTFIRIWARAISIYNNPTIQAVIPLGEEHYILKGFSTRGRVYPITKGIWQFYIDAVSEFGLKSATSEIVFLKV